MVNSMAFPSTMQVHLLECYLYYPENHTLKKTKIRTNRKDRIRTDLAVCSDSHLNLSYLGGRDLEDCSLGQPGQKVHETPISTSKPSVVVQVCHPSYKGGLNRRTVIQAGLDKFETLHQKKLR
jgi:hypothetical protein